MVKFGTSGLRGLVKDLNGPPAASYTLAFLRTLAERGDLTPGAVVCVGRDLRSSSPAIAALVEAAIASAGYQPVDCGALPTPALCLYAMAHGRPAIMVTGSHIPDDRNGLKFYRPDGEIDKADEAAILRNHVLGGLPQNSQVQPRSASPLRDYARRYTEFFGADALKGLRVGVYQHSSVFREVIMEILSAVGAEPAALGRSEAFVPVDTEAVHPDDVAKLRNWAANGDFAAVVSSDGDADRPLIADERGTVVRGDAVGAVTAASLNAGTIVTPMTSNSGLEDNRFGAAVLRTAVGSPFVIAGIAQALEGRASPVIGFEANGGVILGSPAKREGRTLAALPTRDAVLPILCCLAEIKRTGAALSQIVKELGFRPARSSRLQDIAPERSAAFLGSLTSSLAEEVEAEIGPVVSVNKNDGVRLLSDRKEMLYYRASGNAPELRCYVEAASDVRADELLAWGLKFAERSMPST